MPISKLNAFDETELNELEQSLNYIEQSKTLLALSYDKINRISTLGSPKKSLVEPDLSKSPKKPDPNRRVLAGLAISNRGTTLANCDSSIFANKQNNADKKSPTSRPKTAHSPTKSHTTRPRQGSSSRQKRENDPAYSPYSPMRVTFK